MFCAEPGLMLDGALSMAAVGINMANCTRQDDQHESLKKYFIKLKGDFRARE